jgi:adhesin/invasin
MGKNFLALPLILMSVVGFAGEASQALNQAKQNMIQNAYSYGDTAIESWAKDNLSSLRLIEIETRTSEESKPTFRAISLFELTGNEYNKILTQISYSTFDDNETLNTGLVYRTMNADMTRIYGVNIFYDHEFNSGHTRTGLGFEMKSSVFDVNINLYEAMSEIHHVNGAPEVAAGGYDAEIGALLPYLPWAKVYYKKYQWNNETLNIRHGEMFSLYMEPTSRLSIETGMQDDSTTNSHNGFIKLNYILCCNERKMGPNIFTVSKNAYTFGKVNTERMYEKVRRENNIVKVRGGGAFAITASGF